MTRLLLITASIMCCALPHAREAWADAGAVGDVDRAIGKEPEYQSKPKYSLLVLGDDRGAKAWMVEDGRRLFVDRNANGDLTDDPPLKPSNVRHLKADRWDFEYRLDAIISADGTRHTDFVLRRWNDNGKQDNYGLSLSIDGRLPMYAGWFGTFWSDKREDAPVIYFGGPLTPKIQRRKEFSLGETGRRLSVCFVHPGADDDTVSRLSIDALPSSMAPQVTIEWPTADGGKPIRTSYTLTERCCYWEFYTRQFRVPSGVVEGDAKVVVHMPRAAKHVALTTTEIVVPVVPSKTPLVDLLYRAAGR